MLSHPFHTLVSYYIGHKGRHGHEFLEFEISSDGKLRYANNSLYKQVRGPNDFFILFGCNVSAALTPVQDGMIRKEAFLNDNCLTELRRIIESSEILKEDDQVLRVLHLACASAAVVIFRNLRRRKLYFAPHARPPAVA
jgi:hypothetical protein